MKKKLLPCAALMAACLAVSMPIGAKENPEPWSNTLSQSEEHVIKETGIDKRFDIGKTVSVRLDSAYVTKDTKVQLTENSLYKKVGKLIPAPFHFRSVTITKKSGDPSLWEHKPRHNPKTPPQTESRDRTAWMKPTRTV